MEDLKRMEMTNFSVTNPFLIYSSGTICNPPIHVSITISIISSIGSCVHVTFCNTPSSSGNALISLKIPPSGFAQVPKTFSSKRTRIKNPVSAPAGHLGPPHPTSRMRASSPPYGRPTLPQALLCNERSYSPGALQPMEQDEQMAAWHGGYGGAGGAHLVAQQVAGGSEQIGGWQDGGPEQMAEPYVLDGQPSRDRVAPAMGTMEQLEAYVLDGQPSRDRAVPAMGTMGQLEAYVLDGQPSRDRAAPAMGTMGQLEAAPPSHAGAGFVSVNGAEETVGESSPQGQRSALPIKQLEKGPRNLHPPPPRPCYSYGGADGADDDLESIGSAAERTARLQKLYRRSVEWRQQCEQSWEAERRAKDDDDLKGCTFHPSINKSSVKMIDGPSSTPQAVHHASSVAMESNVSTPRSSNSKQASLDTFGRLYEEASKRQQAFETHLQERMERERRAREFKASRSKDVTPRVYQQKGTSKLNETLPTGMKECTFQPQTNHNVAPGPSFINDQGSSAHDDDLYKAFDEEEDWMSLVTGLAGPRAPASAAKSTAGASTSSSQLLSRTPLPSSAIFSPKHRQGSTGHAYSPARGVGNRSASALHRRPGGAGRLFKEAETNERVCVSTNSTISQGSSLASKGQAPAPVKDTADNLDGESSYSAEPDTALEASFALPNPGPEPSSSAASTAAMSVRSKRSEPDNALEASFASSNLEPTSSAASTAGMSVRSKNSIALEASFALPNLGLEKTSSAATTMAMSIRSKSTSPSKRKGVWRAGKYDVPLSMGIPDYTEPAPYQPQITKKGAARNPKTASQLSEGGRTKLKQRLQAMREMEVAKEMAEVTLKPQTAATKKAYPQVKPSFNLRDPEQYMSMLESKQRMSEQKRQLAIHEREQLELAQCTFKPSTTPVPSYLLRMIHGENSVHPSTYRPPLGLPHRNGGPDPKPAGYAYQAATVGVELADFNAHTYYRDGEDGLQEPDDDFSYARHHQWSSSLGLDAVGSYAQVPEQAPTSLGLDEVGSYAQVPRQAPSSLGLDEMGIYAQQHKQASQVSPWQGDAELRGGRREAGEMYSAPAAAEAYRPSSAAVAVANSEDESFNSWLSSLQAPNGAPHSAEYYSQLREQLESQLHPG
eukprot:gene24103-9678_t